MDGLSSEVEVELRSLEPITKTIGEPALRADVVRLLTAEILARLSLKQISLQRFEQPEYDEPDIEMWEELAQPVRSALMALHELRTQVAEFAPESERNQDEVDVAFDLVDDSPPELPLRDSLGQQVDDWLATTLENTEDQRARLRQRPAEEQRKDVQMAIEPLATILINETARFASRLRNPNIVAQRWALLSDLQEFRGKFAKLLGALRIGLLGPFTDLSEDELIGDYRTEAEASTVLREAFVHLELDTERLIVAWESGTPNERRFALEELLVRLMRFAASDAFALVRAPDKRAIIEFRKDLALQLGRDAGNKRAVGELLEGFAKFLEVMRSLNQREALVRHDKAMMADLRGRLIVIGEVLPLDFDSALRLFEEAREAVQLLYGREPMLDVWLRGKAFMSTREEAFMQLEWVRCAVTRSGLN